MNFKIGNHSVGDGCPPFIVAEVGSNWQKLEDCLLSISMAAKCGASAVKFQAFTYEALYGVRRKAKHPPLDYVFYPIDDIPLAELGICTQALNSVKAVIDQRRFVEVNQFNVGDPVYPVSASTTFDMKGLTFRNFRTARGIGAETLDILADLDGWETTSAYKTIQQRTPKLDGQLPLEWLPKLKEKADACGIEFMCSAFSPELLKAVDPYVNAHKIASAELTHIKLLEAARECGKPVILSTGASGEGDIEMAMRVLTHEALNPEVVHEPYPYDNSPSQYATPVPVVLLYCVAAYPAQEINLDCIDLLRRRFGTLVGYSDHSTDVGVIPLGSIRTGATVLEKHFTAVPEFESPDRPHSLEPSQFRRMVDSLGGKTPATLGPTAGEKGMILRHNRRLIATSEILAGDALVYGENFGIYRSLKDDSHAFSPWRLYDVNGRTAKRAVKAGDGIGPGDI